MTEESKYEVYAPYEMIKYVLVVEHKKMLELFEELNIINLYRENYSKGSFQKKYLELRCQIQAKISKLCDLYKNYKSVKDYKDYIVVKNKKATLTQVFKIVAEYEKKGKIMGYESLFLCKEALGKAQFELGINDIEVKKEDSNAPTAKWA